MSVIVGRALPDVRDGLKPVHKRILWAMLEAGYRPDRPHRKSAAVIGDVLKKYHPHGDQSVYDALVRMAQDWSLRYPLVDGHGNFGSVDGDPAAAYRYTEARLAPMAMEMLRDIDAETVDFVPNFDGYEQEPVVLPARFPNLLVNGAGGIAVGMATNIPPHNLGEVIDAVVHYLDNPEATPGDLMKFIKGPDFPTGATIMGRQGIRDAYETGRGSIKVRAVSQVEEGANGRSKIVVTELPYQVNKARLAEKIADLVKTGKMKDIADLKDESNREGMRLVIECKRGANAQVVLNQLYKQTQLQESFGVIMLALVDGVPRTLNLAEMVGYYVDHQVDVVTRRTRYELRRAEERDHIVLGLLIALDHLDEVIKIIRASPDADTARTGLMKKFKLRDPGEPHPGHAAAPPHQARARGARQGAHGAPREDQVLQLAAEGPEEAPRGHQGRAARDPQEARRRAPHEDHGRRGRLRRRGPHRRGGRDHHRQPRRLREAAAGGLVPAAGPRRQGRPGPEPQGRGRGQARLHDDHAPLDAVLHHEGPRVPREGARDPGVGRRPRAASTRRTCPASRSTATSGSAP